MDKMLNSLEMLNDKTIGIIGFGHLGSSLALPLVDSGFAKERLMISYKGSKKTLARAKVLGLDTCLTDTKTLLSSSDIIFFACRPQDLPSLPCGAMKEDTLVISCMAGLPLSILSRHFGGKVVRMMCSGPDTIESGWGIAVTYPRNNCAEDAIRLMGIELYQVDFEEELDSFTVGICIPPILLNFSRSGNEITEALQKMEKRFPVYGRLDGWIDKVMGTHGTMEQSACLDNIMTRGGISESMLITLKNGGSFMESLERGLERGREITAEIKCNLATTGLHDAVHVT